MPQYIQGWPYILFIHIKSTDLKIIIYCRAWPDVYVPYPAVLTVTSRNRWGVKTCRYYLHECAKSNRQTWLCGNILFIINTLKAMCTIRRILILNLHERGWACVHKTIAPTLISMIYNLNIREICINRPAPCQICNIIIYFINFHNNYQNTRCAYKFLEVHLIILCMLYAIVFHSV